MDEELYDDYVSLGDVIIDHIKEHKDSLKSFQDNIESVKARVEKEIVRYQADAGELLAKQYLERYNHDYDLALKELELEKQGRLTKTNNPHRKRNFTNIYIIAKTKIQVAKAVKNCVPPVWEPTHPKPYKGVFSDDKKVDIWYRIIASVAVASVVYFSVDWAFYELHGKDARVIIQFFVLAVCVIGILYAFTKLWDNTDRKSDK